MAVLAPVEYAVAVDRFVSESALSDGSRRVYRIALDSWAWRLVGHNPPEGTLRRGARPPVVPLAVLDAADMPTRLATLVGALARDGASGVNRQLSILRSAVAWWRQRGWIRCDPTAGIRVVSETERASNTRGAPPALASPTPEQVSRLLRGQVALREHLFWRLVYETGVRPRRLLELDLPDLHPSRRSVRVGREWLPVSATTGQLLRWLVAGRTEGPLFLSARRVPAGHRHRCPVTGRARLSYRRAEELFVNATRSLDPTGRGWTLHQLGAASPRRAIRARSC